jgi:hypothetical protein
MRFLSGQSEQPESATFTVDGITSRVEMHVTGQRDISIMGVPQINNPADMELMEEHMHMLSETRSTDFRLTVTKSPSIEARVTFLTRFSHVDDVSPRYRLVGGICFPMLFG